MLGFKLPSSRLPGRFVTDVDIARTPQIENSFLRRIAFFDFEPGKGLRRDLDVLGGFAKQMPLADSLGRAECGNALSKMDLQVPWA